MALVLHSQSFALVLVLLALIVHHGYSLSCYECVSTEPGCGTPFDWRWHWSKTCPNANDKCVKIIERKGAREVITRNCLSSLEYSRHDIPADKYEGCRPASKDIVLGHYVHYQLIKELDIKRDYYDEVTFCFCEFDHWCNSAMNLLPNYFTFWISCSFLFVYTFGFFM